MPHAFFDYFRRRLDVARNLRPTPGTSPGELSPDQHILVGSGLDALANHWSRLAGGPKQGQQRLAEFLFQHGGHGCFGRVAGPYLLRHALEHERRKLAADPSFAGSHVSAIRESIGVAPSGPRVVAWKEDEDVATMVAKPALASVPQDWFDRYRYGGVVYSAHRCAWVHEFDEGDLTDRSLSPDRWEPVYEQRKGTRILVLPGTFMLATYERAIDSFDVFCTRRGVWP